MVAPAYDITFLEVLHLRLPELGEERGSIITSVRFIIIGASVLADLQHRFLIASMCKCGMYEWIAAIGEFIIIYACF